ncbi:hypothetical protein IB277_35520 [Ensifer sp. ENS07]|uniref:hypothetical protein n=1 Tax=Ensifer TaxID=106591 RepID=UPI0013AF570B|nr:hypothetical protein [Ensifer sp. ENS07]MBD9641606.1 hypothetical protein [Ensifer sp. ENS07]
MEFPSRRGLEQRTIAFIDIFLKQRTTWKGKLQGLAAGLSGAEATYKYAPWGAYVAGAFALSLFGSGRDGQFGTCRVEALAGDKGSRPWPWAHVANRPEQAATARAVVSAERLFSSAGLQPFGHGCCPAVKVLVENTLEIPNDGSSREPLLHRSGSQGDPDRLHAMTLRLWRDAVPMANTWRSGFLIELRPAMQLTPEVYS